MDPATIWVVMPQWSGQETEEETISVYKRRRNREGMD
jgi:hypothetical protein